ncbi:MULTISPECIES: MFS transporter [unclassified Beijerinckia]|uniref:MFS transporter n=1 Tax=unclassified Beijerinckia TaxID=2638183 RepID=UPI0008982279|nr:MULTISPECIES: MFS transporter [unclassified Beijerinckia]MDH7796536.1 MFS family permease [Beijerinckia sp. GAS462]SEC49251.1 Predicted arabinose efflux permease, MFS family [Beijerinckia sp. 28-YEA-48]
MTSLHNDLIVDTAPSATGLLGNRWWVVFGSVLGMIAGQGATTIFIFGTFVGPVTSDLGISQSSFSAALLILTIAAAVVTPWTGHMMDKHGVRPVMLPMITLFAVATAALAFMQSSLALIYALFAIQGAFSAIQAPTGYVKVISRRFDRQRGLACGLAMAGVGLGVALLPQYIAILMTHYGWRGAYLGLGAFIFVMAFIPVALFVRDAPGQTAAMHRERSADLPGLTVSEAVKGTRQFWLLVIGLSLAVMAINGVLAQLVVMLSKRGFTIPEAATVMSIAGLAMILGRVLVGYCLDKYHGSYVAMAVFSFPVIGILLLLSGASGPVPYIAAILCGLGIGAELDLMGFLVSRYFGLRAIGTIYGILFAIFVIGSGVGPYLVSLSFEHAQSYAPVLEGFIVALLVVIAMMAFLGPYRYPVAHDSN